MSSQIRRCIRDGAAVYEKQYTTDDWEATAEVIRNRVALEFRLLQDMEASGIFRRRMGLLRVASCDTRAARIVTHEVPGQTLASWLHNAPERRTSLLPWYLAGRWLRTFQSLPILNVASTQPTERDTAHPVAYCDRRLRSLRELGYPWPDSDTHHRLLCIVENLQSEVSQETQEPVWVHADYAPGNLIWGEGVLTPIDFAMAYVGGHLEDATYLIHRLEMQRVYRPWLRLPLAAIRRAILRGLGSPDADGTAGYKLLMIRHLVCRLHTYVWRPPSCLRQSVHDRWVRMVIKRRLTAAAELGSRLDASSNRS